MKKLIWKVLLAAAMVGLLASEAQAVPIFNGDTFADWGLDGFPTPAEAQGPGYYIWSNDPAKTSWSVRWTGGDWTQGYSVFDNGDDHANVSGWFSWNGTVNYTGGEITSVSPVSWDPHDDSNGIPTNTGTGKITFAGSLNGKHYDGFDFIVTPVGDAPIDFHLDSTIYAPVAEGGLGFEAPQGVYIGQNMFSITDYYTGDLDGMIGSCNFSTSTEVDPVPEPGTVLLFGTGLAGLAGLRRKMKKGEEAQG